MVEQHPHRDQITAASGSQCRKVPADRRVETDPTALDLVQDHSGGEGAPGGDVGDPERFPALARFARDLSPLGADRRAAFEEILTAQLAQIETATRPS